ncbi:hypothetical protein KIPB_007926, partial [Kipferlia bialata]
NGPFGAVIVQYDSATNEAIRHWVDCNAVVTSCDPSAHAEVSVIRKVCAELQTVHLDSLSDPVPSYCALYSSCEPCPMCYAASRWARLPVIAYAADRDDAERAGFVDAELYRELSTGSPKGMTHVTTPHAGAPFDLFIDSTNKQY